MLLSDEKVFASFEIYGKMITDICDGNETEYVFYRLEGAKVLFVKVDDLKAGMRLGKPIYNKNGVLLYDRDAADDEGRY